MAFFLTGLCLVPLLRGAFGSLYASSIVHRQTGVVLIKEIEDFGRYHILMSIPMFKKPRISLRSNQKLAETNNSYYVKIFRARSHGFSAAMACFKKEHSNGYV